MSANTQKINVKSVLKYTLLPGIIPRFKELGGTGFGYLAFLIANVFQAVRILPPTHPYVQSANIGDFSIRSVLAEGANHIQFNRQNIDQIAVFGAILLAMVLLVLQFALFLLSMFTGQAFAQDTGNAPFKSIFKTEYPETDIAFLMLDYVFGIPKLFGSNALGTDGTSITPFHQGLHDLFQFYNLSLLVVAVFIFMYYVIVVVIETAQTGVPFGNRFSKIYAPFRLIAAVGLLVPLNYGFNGAQYITFYAAKLGSSMATNGWVLYNRNIDNPLGADNASLIASATPPEINGLLYFSSVYHACREMYKIYVPKNYNPAGNNVGPSRGSTETIKILPYVIVDGKATEFASLSYEQAKKQFGQSDMEVVLGEYDPEIHTKDSGGVRPYCGKVTVSLSNENPAYYKGSASSGGHIATNTGGARTIEKEYYYLLMSLFKTDHKFAAIGERAAHYYIPGRLRDPCWRSGDLGDGGNVSMAGGESAKSCEVSPPFPSPKALQEEMDKYKTNTNAAIEIAINELRKGVDLKLTTDMERHGWGGAGIWYNRIAEMNGSVTSSIYAVPVGKAFPEVLEFVKKEREVSDTASGSCESFSPNLADNKTVKFRNDHDAAIAAATNSMFQFWICGRPGDESALPKGDSGNIILNVIGVVFGINGLFHLREDTTVDPATGHAKTHPLAALSAIGKALVENAIRSMAASVALSTLGSGIGDLLGKGIGPALKSFSSMFVGIATIGLTAGVILYYILPFMPFIYFFFAVGSWVKSIFEAMVGAPLWALAHLRIDGDGFSGRSAASGYFLIFEIFLRPIATVFGLIGAMAVFGAMVSVMNSVFTLVVSNIVGDNPSASTGDTLVSNAGQDLQLGAIDQFFFTIVYAILVYMMATSCFKMIDSIPKQIMRWMGTGVNTFNDNTGDPTENLTQYTALAGSRFAPQVFQGINQAGGAIGGLVPAFVKSTQPPPAA